MGHKVNPTGFRLGILGTWKSRWFTEDDKEYRKFLIEDIKLRKFLMDKLRPAGIVNVEIERSINAVKIILEVARPGVVIGRGGSGLENLKKLISEKLKKGKEGKGPKIELSEIREVKNPDLSSRLTCQRLVDQLVKRYPHRRAINQAMDRVMSAGAKGIKIVLSGRIAGAEISRTEKYSRGSIPLQTLRADIDYTETPALTKSGFIGVKVWINRGERS